MPERVATHMLTGSEVRQIDIPSHHLAASIDRVPNLASFAVTSPDDVVIGVVVGEHLRAVRVVDTNSPIEFVVTVCGLVATIICDHD